MFKRMYAKAIDNNFSNIPESCDKCNGEGCVYCHFTGMKLTGRDRHYRQMFNAIMRPEKALFDTDDDEGMDIEDAYPSHPDRGGR